MDTVEKWEIELDNSCQCSDDDGNLLTDCYGCFDDTLTIVDEMIGQWVENIGFDGTSIKVDGSGMGWDRLDGYAITTVDKIPNALYINGEFRIVFSLEGESLSAVRYSHDEPTGSARFICAVAMALAYLTFFLYLCILFLTT